MSKNQKGIALIAIIVIVVVILIVAFVSIEVLFEDDEKFKRENEAINGIGGSGGTNPTSTLVSQVTSANYGQTVTYTSPNGVSDWKIFYTDNTNVYIISSDYVPNSKVDTTSLGMKTGGSIYNVYWHSDSDLIDTTLSVENWMLRGNSTFGRSQNNYYATASLMNTTKWKGFVNSIYAETAIGGPTLDMYIASWNEVYPSEKIHLSANETGYYLGTSENPNTHIVDMKETRGYTNTLYYPHTTRYENCYGYWIASPSALHLDMLFVVIYSGHVYGASYGTSVLGVRPVVCLKSDIKGILFENNWTLE